MESFSKLIKKEVINTLDGEKIGNIIDAEINMEKGIIENLILKRRFDTTSLFSKRDNICKISLDEVKKIGESIILIEKIL